MRGLVLGWVCSVALVAAPRPNAKLQWLQLCAECHGAEATGRGPAGVRLPGRNLTDTRWRAKRTDEELVHSILFGKEAMPAFGAKLREEDARRLLKELLPVRGK